ncbi:hypothetical protein [Youxingia wuxianensis]|uniref:Uncharacterized protein n=1 Tax=Youxingia wuxianensis TaxID=2763678 RepID=A0A926ELP0_9FIRM|nr:hypothetical protein [Youxingia wuxianensis]MBC8584891.1 hypothetical protein [Youxingia wuxianensis]
MQFILSTILSFVGIGIALAVIIVNVLILFRPGSKWLSVLYTAISLWYGGTLVSSLIRQSSGIYCAMTPEKTLLIYGGLVLLHFYFLWDSVKLLKRQEGKKRK